MTTGNKGLSGKATLTDWKRAEKLWAKHGRPQIVLSFGARGGGAEFALYLREEMMKQTGLSGTEIYIDTIAMLNETFGETKLELAGSKTAGIYKALNDQWKGYFEYALYEARAMIFIVTPDWYRSPNCFKEYLWFQELNKQRPNSLKGISLVIEHDAMGPKTQAVGPLLDTDCIRVRRQWAVKDAFARRKLTGNMKNVWTMSPAQVADLILKL